MDKVLSVGEIIKVRNFDQFSPVMWYDATYRISRVYSDVVASNSRRREEAIFYDIEPWGHSTEDAPITGIHYTNAIQDDECIKINRKLKLKKLNLKPQKKN